MMTPRKGKDAYGNWTMWGDERCVACQAHSLTIQWGRLKLPIVNNQKVDVAKTILRSPRNHIGLNCGCYAKLHRQVAHIVDNMKGRA